MKLKIWSAGLVWLMLCPAVYAANCSVSAQGMDFGEYDLLNTLDSRSDITVTCSRDTPLPLPGAINVKYTLALSVGSGSYSARALTGGVNSVMLYNLYTSASYSAVWGDGGAAERVSGSVKIPSFGTSASATHTVYGRIPGNQSSLEPGTYYSPMPIVVTLEY